MPKRGLTAVQAILDFIYLAQYSLHNEDTLRYMDDALNSWHQNKSCFIDLKVHEDLNIPKFYSLEHYVEAIQFLGTTDNYNTKMFKCLHIDFAKKEQQSLTSLGPASVPTPPSPIWPILLPKVPTSPNKLITTVQNTHHVPLFSQHLKAYIEMLKQAATCHSFEFALTQHFPFQQIDIYHSFKFSPEQLEEGLDPKDIVKASPLNGVRFDTVIVLTGDAAESVSSIGTRIGHVNVLFHLPSQLQLIGSNKIDSPTFWPRMVLAYIEWYTPSTLSLGEHASHNMTTVKHAHPQADCSLPWSIPFSILMDFF
ncbi:hypothetical protein BT96DRAFT_1008138 [Gymnopus androsaceus JB14]|uniref:Uncharacterized protein n=1 Tax=Gymnopus androsaceus JB14 TaxID=1447944 RepID=A0A6A4GFX7_9AGAR|nr:hypothetical protein BT96DRAFT_1008138 [Gymnopus androsaceus JB14]